MFHNPPETKCMSSGHCKQEREEQILTNVIFYDLKD